MRALIVMPLAEQRGGGELMLVHLLRQVEREDLEITVALFEDGPFVQEFRGLGYEVLVIDAGRLRRVDRYVATVLQLVRAARRVDVVWSWMPKAHLYAGPAAVLARRPAIWNQLATPARRAVFDRVATALPARGVIALSTAGAEAQRRLWPRRPVRLVFPGADLNEFDVERLVDRDATRAKLRLPIGVPLIGIVGRLQSWKGMHLAIEAMPTVLARFPQAQLVVVGGAHSGEPGYGNRLRELTKSLGLHNSVRLVGLQRNVAEWMHAMDIVVMASYDEPFGIVVIEAMALGKPVVASDSGGPQEVITPGVDGLTFETGNAAALAVAVVELLERPELADAIGAKARERAEAFSARTYAANAVEAARSLAGR